jgi:hypothetical protein
MASEKELGAGEGLVGISTDIQISVQNGSGSIERKAPTTVPAGKHIVEANIVSPQQGSWDVVIFRDGDKIWTGRVKYGDKVMIEGEVRFGRKNLFRLQVNWSEKSNTTLVVHAKVIK